jgi:hypothetical protein
MSRRSVYWLLQALCWGLIMLFNLPFMLMGGKPFTLANSIATMGLCCLCGMLLSHGWRGYLQRSHTLERPLREGLAVSVSGVLILGTALTLISGFWYWIFLFPDTFQRANWVPTAFLFWTAVIGAWTGSYRMAKSVRRANELEKEKLQSQVLAKEARLAILRQQLNPHFLFNSLNSLRALIFEDAQRASQMVDRLAALLRYSLQSGSDEVVMLAEELVMVNEYLSIEQIRFENRLLVDMNVTEGSKAALLPRMLLQTLVENAVRHGIERSVAGGMVSVRAERNGQRLHLRVTNPGTLHGSSSSTGLGLKNAEQRLSLLMGPDASLHIQQRGTNVEAEVVLPQ